MKTIEQTAIFWLTKEKEGLNPFEKKQLQNWLEENSLHKEAYESNKQIRSAFQALPNEMQSQLKELAHEGVSKTKNLQNLKYIGFAAMFLLSIGFASLKFYESTNPIYSQNLVSSSQLKNEQKLPDDSKIVLDTNSNLHINFYKNKRDVALKKGRAMFYVSKDKKRPFVIKTANTQIEVIGTSFEVSNIKEFVTIKVKEGVVKVSQNTGNIIKTLSLLKKEETISLDKYGKVLNYGKIKTNQIANWEKGFFLFSKTPLKEAMKKFSRYTKLNVEFENENVENTPITGKFSINEFNNFLKALPKIYPLKLIKDEKNVIILEN